jgi:hypothetical protein
MKTAVPYQTQTIFEEAQVNAIVPIRNKLVKERLHEHIHHLLIPIIIFIGKEKLVQKWR